MYICTFLCTCTCNIFQYVFFGWVIKLPGWVTSQLLLARWWVKNFENSRALTIRKRTSSSVRKRKKKCLYIKVIKQKKMILNIALFVDDSGRWGGPWPSQSTRWRSYWAMRSHIETWCPCLTASLTLPYLLFTVEGEADPGFLYPRDGGHTGRRDHT